MRATVAHVFFLLSKYEICLKNMKNTSLWHCLFHKVFPALPTRLLWLISPILINVVLIILWKFFYVILCSVIHNLIITLVPILNLLVIYNRYHHAGSISSTVEALDSPTHIITSSMTYYKQIQNSRIIIECDQGFVNFEFILITMSLLYVHCHRPNDKNRSHATFYHVSNICAKNKHVPYLRLGCQ